MKKQEVNLLIGKFLLVEIEKEGYEFTVNKLNNTDKKDNRKVIDYKVPHKGNYLGRGLNLKEYNTTISDIVLKADTTSDEFWNELIKDIKWKCDKSETLIVQID